MRGPRYANASQTVPDDITKLTRPSQFFLQSMGRPGYEATKETENRRFNNYVMTVGRTQTRNLQAQYHLLTGRVHAIEQCLHFLKGGGQ